MNKKLSLNCSCFNWKDQTKQILQTEKENIEITIQLGNENIFEIQANKCNSGFIVKGFSSRNPFSVSEDPIFIIKIENDK
jgi:hypothetical protein